jgi:hypothetical protein
VFVRRDDGLDQRPAAAMTVVDRGPDVSLYERRLRRGRWAGAAFQRDRRLVVLELHHGHDAMIDRYPETGGRERLNVTDHLLRRTLPRRNDVDLGRGIGPHDPGAANSRDATKLVFQPV